MWKVAIFALISSGYVYGQTRASEAGIISDNDLYTSTIYDKYYTNGLELYFRYLNNNTNEKIIKKITEFKIGQYIYNPHTREADNIYTNDRPFAGYLFVEAGRNYFYSSESVLKVNVQLGYVGSNSFAEESQRAFHAVFGYKKVQGWQHQIENTVAVQANAFYSKKLSAAGGGTILDFHVQSEVNTGTVLNGISVGILSRISLKPLLPVYNSGLYGAALNADPQFYKTEKELYFYLSPNLNYQLTDATIQGSLFGDNSPVTFDLIPFRFQAEAGIKYRTNRWNLSYAFQYRSKEAKNAVIKSYFYGSICIGYLLN